MLSNITNLDECKELGIVLNYSVPIIPDAQIPFICSHPFTNSMFAVVDGELKDLSVSKNANDFLSMIKDMIHKADSLEQIFMHLNKSYYLTYFRLICNYLSDKDFARWLSYSWISEENPNQDVNAPLSICISWFRKSVKQYLMNKEEFAYYKALPNVIKVYRGVGQNRNPDGLSYTVNKDEAIWFANRWGGEDNYLIEIDVPKKYVLAYFNSRNEEEIVVNTSKKEVKNKMKIIQL